MKKFKYKSIVSLAFLFDAELNAEGAEGWELVGFSVATTDGPNEYKLTYNYIFKREVTTP